MRLSYSESINEIIAPEEPGKAESSSQMGGIIFHSLLPHLFPISPGCAVTELREGQVSLCDFNLWTIVVMVVQEGLVSLGAEEISPQTPGRRHLGRAGGLGTACLRDSTQHLLRALSGPHLPSDQAWVPS